MQLDKDTDLFIKSQAKLLSLTPEQYLIKLCTIERQQKALKVANIIFEEIDEEKKKYEDIDLRGGNPYEYGKRTREEVVADVLMKRKLI